MGNHHGNHLTVQNIQSCHCHFTKTSLPHSINQGKLHFVILNGMQISKHYAVAMFDKRSKVPIILMFVSEKTEKSHHLKHSR